MSKKIDILKINGKPLIINEESLLKQKNDLEKFITEFKYCKTLKHAKEVLFSHEIQANNFIEGYKDDVETIYNVIHRCSKISNVKKKQRIMNLYRAYKYILCRKDINKDTLKELYSILSKDLLCEYDVENMGQYYRTKPVYIYFSNRIDVKPDEGVDFNELEYYMNCLLEYINIDNDNLSPVELFFKSQIIHFYLVYIHPYFDINGRTSRTLGMWYLLNNKANPFVIFNRAIQLHKAEYYKIIRRTKMNTNITYFLQYMLEHTREELEKEYIMNMIKNTSNVNLSSLDFQTLHYILSLKYNNTYLDFVRFYNTQNERKSPNSIYNEMLKPLLDNGIIVQKECTSKQVQFSDDGYNHYFSLNESLYENDPEKIKCLKI